MSEDLARSGIDVPTLSILGTRGIPGRHGGFETFAEELATYLVGRGWAVNVYCQDDEAGPAREEIWHGVRLVHLPAVLSGAAGTVEFDCRCAVHALRSRGPLLLTLGYNTAFLAIFYRLAGRTNVFNMDGLEWRRSKWSLPVRAWFYANERLGCYLGHHLIADHPKIADHLATRVATSKITMIPYGAHPVGEAESALIGEWGLDPENYALVVARPEPENSLLEIVQAFSRTHRGIRLAVVGLSGIGQNRYQQAVLAAAGPEVLLLGPVYEKTKLAALRHFALFYVHGHRVGGTNPALVEALGARCAVLAHDNPFNRWVAGPHARYFGNADECDREMSQLIAAPSKLQAMRESSRAQHERCFEWPHVLSAYEQLLSRFWKASRGKAQGG